MSKLSGWHDGGVRSAARRSLVRHLDTRGAIEFIDVAEAVPAAGQMDGAQLPVRFRAREDQILLSRAAAFAAM